MDTPLGRSRTGHPLFHLPVDRSVRRGAIQSCAPSRGDPFGQRAPKLAALLGQRLTSRVLLVGEVPDGWPHDLTTYFPDVTRVHTAEQLSRAAGGESRFDLMLAGVMCRHQPAPARMLAALPALRRVLAPSGTLVLLAENRLSLAGMWRDPIRLGRSGLRTVRGYRSALHAAGFSSIDVFLPVPHLHETEEFVAVGSVIDLPAGAPYAERLAQRAGVDALLRDGAAFLASGTAGGLTALTEELGARLPGDRADPLRISRFAFRRRGALVLFGERAARRWVIRMTTDPVADQRVRRNAEWVDRLTGASTISPHVRSLVPRHCGTLPLRGGIAYVEQHREGTIGWKLISRLAVEQALRRQAIRFTMDLERQTARRLALGDVALTQLSSADGGGSRGGGPDPVALLRNALQRRMIGTEQTVAVAHGDYGYGNLLADPRTGQLLAVIDWDQAREDLAGVDLCNLEVQRAVMLQGLPIRGAFQTVFRTACAGTHAPGEADRAPWLPASHPDGVLVIAWTAMRYVQRVMSYAQPGEAPPPEVRDLVDWACTLLADHA